MILKHDVGIFTNLMPDYWCSEQIEYFEKSIERGLTFDRTALGKQRIDISDRSRMIELTEDQDWARWKPFVDNFRKAWLEYTERYVGLEKGIFDIKHIKMQRTLPGEGYHIWHNEHDLVSHENTGGVPLRLHSHRIATWILYLNDEFEAGETELLHKHMRIKPETGQFIIFPCNYTHMHRGNPPIGNAKYILTGWVFSN